MKKGSLFALAAAAAVLAVAAILAKGGSAPSAPKLAGKQILPGFNAADVARIEVGDKLVLAAGDGGWTIETMNGYPADREKIVENVLKLKDLKVGQVARGRKIASPVAVTLKDVSGKTVASLSLGETHMRKPTGQAAMYGGSYPDGRYVAFGEHVVLVKDTLDAFDGDAKKWCNARIASIPSSDVEAVSFACGGEKVELTKGTNSVWTLKGLGPKEELDTSKTYSLDSALSYLDFTSVAAPGLGDDVTGFSTGCVYTVTTKGGTNHVATVGNKAKDGSDRYFKLDDGKWIYTISSYSAESMMKKRSDLVKEKPEPKPEEAKEAKPETAEAKPEQAKEAEGKGDAK